MDLLYFTASSHLSNSFNKQLEPVVTMIFLFILLPHFHALAYERDFPFLLLLLLYYIPGNMSIVYSNFHQTFTIRPHSSAFVRIRPKRKTILASALGFVPLIAKKRKSFSDRDPFSIIAPCIERLLKMLGVVFCGNSAN